MNNEKEKSHKATTKQSRGWCFTQPASGEHGMSKDELETALAGFAFIAGLEVAPTTGYRHWQGYLRRRPSGPVRFTTLKKALPFAHLEPARTTVEAYEYCIKDAGKPLFEVAGDLAREEVPESVSGRSAGSAEARVREAVDAGMSRNEILDTVRGAASMMNFVRDRCSVRDERTLMMNQLDSNLEEVVFLWGPSGVGKTYLVMSQDRTTYRALPMSAGPYDRLQSFNQTLMLDEFPGISSKRELGSMLQILDRYPVRLPCRYQDVVRTQKRIVVVSNNSFAQVFGWVLTHFPAQYIALARRFTNVWHMPARGVLVEDPVFLGSDQLCRTGHCKPSFFVPSGMEVKPCIRSSVGVGDLTDADLVSNDPDWSASVPERAQDSLYGGSDVRE